jgi:hypothetical protein
MIYRLGKKPTLPDHRDLLVSSYVALDYEPPETVFYQTAVFAQGGKNPWPMYGNDTLGDCTCAAAGHMIETWTASANKLVTIPVTTIVDAYNILSPNDDGCELRQVLDYWRGTGFGADKISGYAAVELQNKRQAMQALDLFGTIYLGLSLPNAVIGPASDWLTNAWYLGNNRPTGDWAPNPDNGHCVPVVAYDGAGLGIVTWGAYKTMDWAFYDAYVDGAFAVLSPDWIAATSGKAPPGFFLSQLQADLAAI